MHSPEGALLWTISLFCVGPFLLFWVRAFLAGIDEGYDAAEAVVIKNRRLFFLAFAAGIAVILVGNAMAGFP